MTHLRQLTSKEVFFIGGETSTVYQHTGGLTIMDCSEAPGFSFAVFRQHMEERIGKIPQFRWKLHQVPLGLDLPYWVEDENFSFDHHIRRIAVPSPGDDKALAELVSYLYTRHLDRNRPLWETWFIEGLPQRRFALFQKMHHCMMDGEGAASLGGSITDFEPNAPPRAISPVITGARPGQVPPLWRESLNTAMGLYGLPLRAGREVVVRIRQGFGKQLRQGIKAVARPPVPMPRLNGQVSSNRGFVYGALPLADVKKVKDYFGCKLNDVVLALVSSSLRSYLSAQDDLPGDSLRAAIAVSLRKSGDDEFSNNITTIGVALGTDIADPVQRLRAIATETEEVKRGAHSGQKGMLELLELLPPVMVNLMMNRVSPEMAVTSFGCNLLVSNVRGPDRPMYIGGARQIGIYPMSIITPGSGINITCISYVDDIDFGITFAPDLVPEPWSIIAGLQRSLAEYLSLTRKKPARRRATPGKRRSTGKKRIVAKR